MRLKVLVNAMFSIACFSLFSARAEAPELNKSLVYDTKLYVGTQANCNAGVVTTNPNHLGCQTQFIGYTVNVKMQSRFRLTPLYVGVQGFVNAGVVSSNKTHLNGATRFIGYSTIEIFKGTLLLEGTKHNCNAGVVSTNPRHLNCATKFIGWTLP
jgi:hypothetical protein